MRLYLLTVNLFSDRKESEHLWLGSSKSNSRTNYQCKIDRDVLSCFLVPHEPQQPKRIRVGGEDRTWQPCSGWPHTLELPRLRYLNTAKAVCVCNFYIGGTPQRRKYTHTPQELVIVSTHNQ